MAIETKWQEFCATVSDADLLEAMKRLTCGQSHSAVPSQITVNGMSFSEPSEVLKQFALHFFPPPAPTNACPGTPVSYAPVPVRLDFVPISDSELADAIASLSPSVSPGIDGISAGLLSLSSNIIFPLLRSIMNSALQCSHFPSQWRHARVKIIPKPSKGNYALPSSFRPISIVNTMSKVFEKFAHWKFGK